MKGKIEGKKEFYIELLSGTNEAKASVLGGTPRIKKKKTFSIILFNKKKELQKRNRKPETVSKRHLIT